MLAHAEPTAAAQRLADERPRRRPPRLLADARPQRRGRARQGRRTGYISGSLTLGTDSLHSVLDASSNVLALFGLRWAAVPADARHPYGRQKIEILAALGIGVLIIVGLFEFGAAAVHALLVGHPAPRIGLGGFAIVLGDDGGSTCGWPATSAARRTELGSELLRADARHTQSDLYASVAVVASFVAIRAGISPGGRGGHPDAGRPDRPRGLGRVPRQHPRSDRRGHAGPAQVVAVLARTVRGGERVHRVRSSGMRGAVELDFTSRSRRT